MNSKRIGIIGFGARMSGLWSLVLKQAPDFDFVALVDPRPESAKGCLEHFGYNFDDVTLYNDVDEMLDKADLDGVFIASNCNTHANLSGRDSEK